MSEEPETPSEGIADRRLRHDVDDVYEIVTTVLHEQRRQGARLTRIEAGQQELTTRLTSLESGQNQQTTRLTSLEARLTTLEAGQKEILTVLREGRG